MNAEEAQRNLALAEERVIEARRELEEAGRDMDHWRRVVMRFAALEEAP